MTSSVYEFTNLATGVITVDAGVIGDQVEAEYQNTFGQNLNTAPNTPQGLLISSETAARIAVANNNAVVANQINPNVSGGVFLDALLALTGSQRLPATSTIVLVTLTGVNGTLIPQFSQASATVDGTIYYFEASANYTIPSDGIYVGAIFNSILTGPIPCPATLLNMIVTPVLGWETISNPAAEETLGTTTQSDIAARVSRTNELGIQGSSLAQAIIGIVSALPGFQSMKFLENVSGDTLTIENVSMVGHSIYMCIAGADLGIQTEVVGIISGTPATSIAAGSQASSNGYVFQTTATVVIGSGGTVNANFQAVDYQGPINVGIGTLDTIVTPISGWASVTNDAIQYQNGTYSLTAEAIVSKKSGGCAYNNGSGVNIAATVVVPYSGQNMTVLFDTPNLIPINVIIVVTVYTPIQDPITTVQTAITNYANGLLEGIPGLIVGQNVSSFEIAGAVTSQYPGVYVSSTLIAKNPTTPTTSTEIAINPYEQATIVAGNIQVTVNYP